MINILPKRQKNKVRHEYRMRLLTAIFGMIIILSLFATLLLIPVYVSSNYKENLTERKLENFNKNNFEIEIEDISGIVNEVNNNLIVLNTKEKNDYYLHEVLESILSLSPKGIKMLQILYNERSDDSVAIEVYGEAKDRDTLQDFKNTIEQHGRFKNIDLPISNFVDKKDIDFSISFSL
ncbi:MAG: hypothetical protein U9R00_02815 [Patescibacteria group bacterium]|nr:hypothetical protein [Patescibacteria group bacterium]